MTLAEQLIDKFLEKKVPSEFKKYTIKKGTNKPTKVSDSLLEVTVGFKRRVDALAARHKGIAVGAKATYIVYVFPDRQRATMFADELGDMDIYAEQYGSRQEKVDVYEHHPGKRY